MALLRCDSTSIGRDFHRLLDHRLRHVEIHGSVCVDAADRLTGVDRFTAFYDLVEADGEVHAIARFSAACAQLKCGLADESGIDAADDPHRGMRSLRG